MPYKLKHLSTQQLQKLMKLSRATAHERSTGAEGIVRNPLDLLLDSSPEEQELEQSIASLSREQKLELMALMQLGNEDSIHGETCLDRLMEPFSKDSDEHLHIKLTNKGKTLSVYLERATPFYLQHHHGHH